MSLGMSDEVLKLDNQFCFVVYALSRKITAQYRPLLASLGLTYPQYLVMLVLWQTLAKEKQGVAVKFIGERLMLETGTLTPLLKRLEANGFICRQRAEEDERSILISLTEQGKQLKEKAQDIPGKMLCMTDYRPEDLLKLKQQLKEMLESF